MTLRFCCLFHTTNGRSTPDASLEVYPDAIFIRVVLGTGRLTIARAIVVFFLDEVWEVELNFQRKKRKNIAGIITHTHSFNGPVQVPLAHRDTDAEFCLNNSFIIQLFLAFPVS